MRGNKKAVQSCSSGSTCPPTWLYFGGSCYQANSTNQPWGDARTFCQYEQGELVTINSESEQNFLYQTMAINKTLWIGLVKKGINGSFTWSSGSILTYENWLQEPLKDGDEKCGEMTDYGPYRGKWNDKPCRTRQPWICEKGGLRSKCK